MCELWMLSVQSFVAEVVRRRVGKYTEPEHPIQLTHREAQQVHRKAVQEVLGKEHQVCSNSSHSTPGQTYMK